MHISLQCSDMLYTLKLDSHAVSLQHVPYSLISLLFSSPACNIQASSPYAQRTTQMDTRSLTELYERKNSASAQLSTEGDQKY